MKISTLNKPKPGAAPTNISLRYLPGYADFLLQNCLAELVRELIAISMEEDVPLLQYLSTYSEEELFTFGLKSNTELLTLLAANKAGEYIDKATAGFVANQIPHMDREEISVEDITKISFVRRKVFRKFLHHYSNDTSDFAQVMEDVDRFTTVSEAASFNAYNNIQQERIFKINQDLAIQHEALLEAQNFAQMGSFFWDTKDGNSSYTPGAQAILGIKELSGLQSFFENVLPADRDKLQAAIDKAFNEDGLYECEYTYVKDDIKKRIWSRGIVHFENGFPIHMKGTIMDITNKNKILERLQISEAMHEQAQALTHLGNWSWDISENSIKWSNEMYRIYGLEPQSEEITFDRFMSLIHPDDREKRLNEIQQSLQSGKVAEYFFRIVNPDGTIKMLKGKGEMVTVGNTPVKLLGTCQDITKEHLLNTELQEKEQNFKKLINNAPDAVIVINTENIITLWNAKSEEIFGWTSLEVTGRPLTEIIIPQGYREAHEQGMQRFLKTGEIRVLNKTMELSACNKTGQEFYISLTVSATTQNGNIAFIAFIRDITAQKEIQIDLQKKKTLLEYQNLELERVNEELESFNFAASHDLQEPLRKIQTYSSRIIDQAKELFTPGILEDFNKIRSSSARMQNLIEDLLKYAQNTLKSQDSTSVDLNAMIEEIKTLFINGVEEKKVHISVEKLPVVKVVAFQFFQLLMNLLINSIKYQRQNTPPEIIISSCILKGEHVSVRGIVPDSNYLMISIKDNGIGFDQQYADKIFELFTRLHGKNMYSGTGIGLATCKKIVHNHRGFIHAESELGKGATFFIYLPQECIVN